MGNNNHKFYAEFLFQQLEDRTRMRFEEMVKTLPERGLAHHRETILENSIANAQYVKQTIRDIPVGAVRSVVLSAGPSLYRQKIVSRLKNRFHSIVATDGAYIQCLRGGLIPRYVITLDPHPTRMVRWFGDHSLETNAAGDDYFKRQDLDVEFRKATPSDNAENIRLVNELAKHSKFIVATTAPANVVQRLLEAGGALYWFVPLVDDPEGPESLTRAMCEATKAPAMNTGATVGNAAWLFTHQVLKSHDIALAGFDFGYPTDTPLEKTQEWNLLSGEEHVVDFYPKKKGHWGQAIASPTYWWYMQNLLHMLKVAQATVTNCSGEGLLMGAGVECKEMEQWLGT